MLEALWSLDFVSDRGFVGAGVVILETNRIYGGDANYYYIGKYNCHNDTVDAEVKVTHYAGPVGSVFGPIKEVTLKLNGKQAPDTFQMTGITPQGQKVVVRLIKRAELP